MYCRLGIVGAAILMLSACQTTGGYKPVAEVLPALNVTFADTGWDGKVVPKGQQCSKFGGLSPKTPALKVSGLPAGTNAVLVEFNDASYFDLSTDGGHGVIGFHVSGSSAVLPGVPGETSKVPDPAFLVSGNRATGSYATQGYLPPCSGGNGNQYFAIVKAVHQAEAKGEENLILAQSRIDLGRY